LVKALTILGGIFTGNQKSCGTSLAWKTAAARCQHRAERRGTRCHWRQADDQNFCQQGRIQRGHQGESQSAPMAPLDSTLLTEVLIIGLSPVAPCSPPLRAMLTPRRGSFPSKRSATRFLISGKDSTENCQGFNQ